MAELQADNNRLLSTLTGALVCSLAVWGSLRSLSCRAAAALWQYSICFGPAQHGGCWRVPAHSFAQQLFAAGLHTRGTLLPPLPAAPAEVTRCWRDTTLENCDLRSQLALLQASGGSAGGSRGSHGSMGSGSASDLGSPAAGLGGGWGGAGQLPSPGGGWPSPMLL